MRTREEQTLELAVRLAYPLHYDDGHLREAEDIIHEAERRAEQRVRAECAADTRHYPVRYSRAIGRNIDEMKSHLLKGSLYPMGDAVLIWANEGDIYMPGSAVLIDAAMEGVND